MPKTKPILRESPTLRKAITGIAGLDEITGGGLPAGRTTIVCGGPGCGKTMLGIEFLVRGATEFNEPSVLMAFEETPEDMAKNVGSLGFDPQDLANKKKLYLDYVYVEPSEIREAGDYDLEGLFIRLQSAAERIGAKASGRSRAKVRSGATNTRQSDFSRDARESEEIVLAIRRGKIDALVISNSEGDQVLALQGTEHPYRLLLETINDGIATLDAAGTVLYANSRIAAILRAPADQFVGTSIETLPFQGQGTWRAAQRNSETPGHHRRGRLCVKRVEFEPSLTRGRSGTRFLPARAEPDSTPVSDLSMFPL